MVLIPLILNYGINTNAMEIARFALLFGRRPALDRAVLRRGNVPKRIGRCFIRY
jgi:hypothetical protein